MLARLTMTDAPALIHDMATRARAAARLLARTDTATKSQALAASAAAIRTDTGAICAANARDMAAAEAAGLTPALLDRLKLTPERVAATADGVAAVAALADPVGDVIDQTVRPNGLVLSRVRVPLGVVGIIYESRPNVTADAAALCVMAGNAAILRGGSEAVESNRAIHAAFVRGLEEAGLPADAAQLVPVTDRAAVGAMLAAHGLIDIIVPRGGKGLVARVQDEARVPVLAHLDGINHSYVDGAANIEMAERDSRQRQDAAHRHLRRDRNAADRPRLSRRRRAGGGAGRDRLRTARGCRSAGAGGHRGGVRRGLGHRVSRRGAVDRDGRWGGRRAGAYRPPRVPPHRCDHHQ